MEKTFIFLCVWYPAAVMLLFTLAFGGVAIAGNFGVDLAWAFPVGAVFITVAGWLLAFLLQAGWDSLMK